MEAMMNRKLEALRQELQQTGSGHESPPLRRGPDQGFRRNREPYGPARDEAADHYYQSSSHGSHRRHRHDRDMRPLQDGFRGVKLKIPPFHGKNDPDAYLEWEKKIELVFDCQQYTDTNKVKVAATEFYDYALSWWDQLVTSRRRNGEYPVESWQEMKTVMRKRFVPSHHHRELHQRLRRLNQGSKSVEEYYQELETLLIRADVAEDREATMSRFLGGLNREIQDRLEMQHYVELEEMLHKALLIEQQLKRRPSTRTSYGAGTMNSKPSFQRDNKDTTPRLEAKPFNAHQDKGKAIANPTRSRDIKCFKCQGKGHYANECSNKRVMILLENGEIASADEMEESETSEEYEELPTMGQLMVSRRSLNLQPKAKEHEQRENLFHSRCLVQGKVCSLIIDGGSCTNVASEDMVNKLGLTMMRHPKPYPLQWLNDSGELKVTNQVKVPLSIGKYEDEVLCDVLPIEAGHILLGRPWQSDRKVTHDGYTNKHSFVCKGRKTTLVPMTPQEVYHDQLHLKQQKS